MKKWILSDCFLCDQPSRELICRNCQQNLPWRRHACWRCAVELPTSSGNTCGSCLVTPPPWQYFLCPWRFESPIAQLIHHMKFSFTPHIADYLGKILGQHAQAFQAMDPVDLIVPVPLHRLRQSGRLYNQASWIARAAARHLQLPVNENCLRRTRHTRAQAKLKQAKERHRNIQAAFAVSNPPPAKHIALIDDVSTTGATARACIDTWRQKSDALFSVWCLASGRK